jgi:hypothetical protein
MDAMSWFSGTGFVDGVIAITLVEAVVLWAWSRRRGGIDFDALAPSLASGLMLMVALRMAVGGAAWPWVVLPVALAGLAHLWDLRRRWSRARPSHAAPLSATRAAPSSPH